MQDLQSIVKRMIAAGESEDNIALVIKNYKPSQSDVEKIPETKGNTSHVPGKDLTVTDAMLGGARGWLKGATLDLPSSIVGGVKALFNPIDTIKSIPEGLNSMWDTAMRAGSDPEAFGRMTGQMGGQPLVTGGLVKSAPIVKTGMGRTLQRTGGFIKRHQPVTGIVPPIAMPRSLRMMEKGVGQGMEWTGNRMIPKPETPVPNYNFTTSGLPDIDVSGFDNYSMPPEIAPRFPNIAKPAVTGMPDNRLITSKIPYGPDGREYTSVPDVSISRPVSNTSGMPLEMRGPGTYSMPPAVNQVPKPKPPVDAITQKAIEILTKNKLEVTPATIKVMVRNLKAAATKGKKK